MSALDRIEKEFAALVSDMVNSTRREYEQVMWGRPLTQDLPAPDQVVGDDLGQDPDGLAEERGDDWEARQEAAESLMQEAWGDRLPEPAEGRDRPRTPTRER